MCALQRHSASRRPQEWRATVTIEERYSVRRKITVAYGKFLQGDVLQARAAASWHGLER